MLPHFLYPSSNLTMVQALESQITLNCTVELPYSSDCDLDLRWMKDNQFLDNNTHASSTQW